MQLDRAANASLNLAAVRRFDPDVSEIVASVAFTAVYVYDQDAGKWVRVRCSVVASADSP